MGRERGRKGERVGEREGVRERETKRGEKKRDFSTSYIRDLMSISTVPDTILMIRLIC